MSLASSNHGNKQTSEWLNQVIIRHLRKDDLPALEWDGEYIQYRKLYRAAFERSLVHQTVLWIAELPNHGIIGQLFIQLDSDNPDLADGNTRAYLYAFRIKPPYRCVGLGSRMMQMAESDLIRRSYRVITLNVTQENKSAIRLYKRCGYIITGPDAGSWTYPDHEGVWQTVEQPSWRMQKILSGQINSA